jgi:predicted O-methyltransferase YrrM
VSVTRPPLSPRALAVARACKGFLDEAEGQRLYELAYDHAPLGPIVEVGSYCGKSSVWLGSGAATAGGLLVCVDHHRGNEEQQPGELYHDPDLVDPASGAMDSLGFLRRTLRAAGLEASTVVVVTSSRIAATLCCGPFGMVFIDGGHTFEAAETDLACWAPQVAPGGILAIHDLFPDPADGGQAPITIYRAALAGGAFDELPGTKTLGVLRRKAS